MSLVSTWVRLKDGHWYKNPVIHGHVRVGLEVVEWFICFDDDDPPEIVIELPQGHGNVPARFGMLALQAVSESYHFSMAQCRGRFERALRIFGERVEDGFKDAVSTFVEILAPMVAEPEWLRHEGYESDLPSSDCVLLDLSGLPQDWRRR